MQIANEAPVSFRASAARPGPISLITTAVREVISRRRLIRYLILADTKKKGADTVLGNVWWVLDPLLATLVYVVVMQFIFARKIEHFPLYLLAAVIPFKWFTATVGDTVSSVVRAGQLIKQIQFPKIVLPLAAAGSEVVSYLFGTLIMLVVLLFYPGHASPMLLWIPVIAVVQFVFALGFTLILSAVTVFYRDIGILVGHLMRLLFFMSPILWSFDSLGDRGGALQENLGAIGFKLIHLNPMAVLITQYRHVTYGTATVTQDAAGNTINGFSPPTAPDLVALFWVLMAGIVLTVIGAWVFKRVEPAFAKVL